MEQLPKIVQQRLRMNPKPGVHPDPDLLTAFAEKSLHDRERSQVLQHLTKCAECRDVLSLAMPEAEPLRSPEPKTASWLSWPVLRWGALAACVVVVGAAVTLHYGPQNSTETLVARKAPAAQAIPSRESNAPEQPREKLAAKIPPPTPFQPERDLGFADKLAERNEKGAGAGMVAPRAEMPALRVLDQDDKLQQLTNDGQANAVAVNSADKPAPPQSVQVAAAPAPSPATRTTVKESQAAKGNVAGSDAADRSVPAATETVTVEAETASKVETAPSAEHKAKDESSRNESQKEDQAARAAAMRAKTLGGRKTDVLSAAVGQDSAGAIAKRSRADSIPPRWTLSGDGVLQRSLDSGKTWQTIRVASNVVFRALAANDSDIWVGGAAGALYHSSDAGQHWIQAHPVAEGKVLTADIVTVEFIDVQHGTLTTANRETWTTMDAGDTWQKH